MVFYGMSLLSKFLWLYRSINNLLIKTYKLNQRLRRHCRAGKVINLQSSRLQLSPLLAKCALRGFMSALVCCTRRICARNSARRRLSSIPRGRRDVFFLERFKAARRSVFHATRDRRSRGVVVSRHNGGFSCTSLPRPNLLV